VVKKKGRPIIGRLSILFSSFDPSPATFRASYEPKVSWKTPTRNLRANLTCFCDNATTKHHELLEARNLFAFVAQADFPVQEQRSRERLFNNIQTGIERGFEQAHGILEGLQALDGDVKDTVDSTMIMFNRGLPSSLCY